MSNFNFLGSFLGKSADFKKDGHDLSNAEVFHQGFGKWSPIKMIECVPDEYYDVSIGGEIQTAPMREDNFQNIFHNLKAVFIPYSSVYRDYLSQSNVDRPTRKDPLFPNALPKLTFNADVLLSYCVQLYTFNELVSELETVLGGNISPWAIKSEDVTTEDETYHVCTALNSSTQEELTLYKVTSDGTISGLVTSSDYPSLFTWITSYWMDDDINYQSLSQLYAFFDKLQSLGGTFILWDILNMLDMLSYGNYYPAVTHVYGVALTAVQSGSLSFYTLLPQVSDGSLVLPTDLDELSNFWHFYYQIGFLDLMPILGYQAFVYSSLTSNYIKPFTRYITADYLMTPILNEGVDGFNTDGTFFDLDSYSLTLSNSLVYSFLSDESVSIGSLTCIDWLIYLFGSMRPLLDPDLFTTAVDSVVQGSIPSTTSSSLTTNLVQTLADTSALYKLRQDLKRAGVRRDKQMEVIFGTKPHNPLVPETYVLASNTSKVNITTLLNQAETAEAPLGARGARGNGYSGLNFKFKSKEFGWIFILSSFTCPTFYENFMIHKQHRTSYQSLFDPRFNHLGLEPVLKSDCSFMNRSAITNTVSYVNLDQVIGYSARYHEYKQAVNLAHGLFTNFGLAVPQKNPDGTSRYVVSSLQRGSAVFGGFVSTVIDQQTDNFGDYSDLYFAPDMLNNIFVNMVDSYTHSSPISDYFRCIFNYKVHKVSPMPKLGLLKLDI